MKKSLIFLFLLSACSGGPQLPPVAPTMSNIDTAIAQINSSPNPPEAILTVGSTLDDTACYGWLDQQILGSQQASALQGVLGTIGGIGAATGHPAGIGAAAGAGALSSIIGAAQANSLVGNDPVAAYGLVLRERQAWQAAVGTPMDRVTAWAFVNSYHQLCSLGGIRLAMHMAALTVPVTADVLAPRIGLDRVLPPVVTVGAPPILPVETSSDMPSKVRRRHVTAPLAEDKSGREWEAVQRMGRAAYERTTNSQ